MNDSPAPLRQPHTIFHNGYTYVLKVPWQKVGDEYPISTGPFYERTDIPGSRFMPSAEFLHVADPPSDVPSFMYRLQDV